ncbi:carbon-nitrogen hydrolase family protein [Gammaproteobacteria bacterium]|nr:carbon-nitrogen hydrolase family protein [Gammaproteobacteria bacterium]
MKNFSIAGLQLDLEYTNNKTYLIEKINQTVSRYPWINMVVATELAVGGASRSQEFSLDNHLRSFQELAKEKNVWLIPGSFYHHNDEKVTNVAPVISNQGKIVSFCTKNYPFEPYERGIEGGKDSCVFEIEGVGIFGVHICYDLWFPETSRALAMKGAQIIIHPSLTDTCDRNEEKIMARATAIQQQCYYFDVNAGGKQGCGQSIIVGPEGEVLTELGSSEEVALLEINLDKVDQIRRRGIKGLGQPLKSFRDNPFYNNDEVNKDYLKSLGDLEMPKKLK